MARDSMRRRFGLAIRVGGDVFVGAAPTAYDALLADIVHGCRAHRMTAGGGCSAAALDLTLEPRDAPWPTARVGTPARGRVEMRVRQLLARHGLAGASLDVQGLALDRVAD